MVPAMRIQYALNLEAPDGEDQRPDAALLSRPGFHPGRRHSYRLASSWLRLNVMVRKKGGKAANRPGDGNANDRECACGLDSRQS